MVNAQPLRVVFLGSGSSGNAAAITDGTTTVLLDCGFSAREIGRRLDEAGISAHSVEALLVTHEHGDHIRGVDVFSRRHASACPVYATRGTLAALKAKARVDCPNTVRSGEPLRVGTLSILPFRISHDAAEPVGYRFESADTAIGIATDTGVLTSEAAEALGDVDILCLESNHDLNMLERGPYPAFLKHRIRSTSGHLSNDDAAAALARLASNRLRTVFALHRSHTNNTADLAAETLGESARRIGLDVRVVVAPQHEVCDSHPPQGQLFGSD